MKITPPAIEEYPEYFNKYISKVHGEPITELTQGLKKISRLISKQNKKQLAYRYAEGKWNIKEILVHLMDAERVFCYRALRFARKDETPLPSFDENVWVPNSLAGYRKIKSIMEEYAAVRDATTALFSNMDDVMFNCSGIANGRQISVRSILYTICGHELRHIEIIKERYLSV